MLSVTDEYLGCFGISKKKKKIPTDFRNPPFWLKVRCKHTCGSIVIYWLILSAKHQPGGMPCVLCLFLV